MAKEILTKEITNFSGRLTRIVNGDLNSGFAKFTSSWGYDPFSKPMNLTWLEQPTDISASIWGSLSSDLILDAQTRVESTSTPIQYVYMLGQSGKLYKVQESDTGIPNLDSVVGITSVLTSIGVPTFTYGGAIRFFGSNPKLYASSDSQIVSSPLPPTGAGPTIVASVGGVASIFGNVFHPLQEFAGQLCFGNGPTIGVISETGTVTSSIIGVSGTNTASQLIPPFPPDTRVNDLEVSPDFDYLLVGASNMMHEQLLGTGPSLTPSFSGDGFLFKWNGSDTGTTAGRFLGSYAVTAMQTYLGNQMFFSNDSFGASVNDGTKKILSLPNNKSPFPNATDINGNFLTWFSPEYPPNSSVLQASLYYFGSLDEENPSGLWRVARIQSTQSSVANISFTPMNRLVSNKSFTENVGNSSIFTAGFGKHYLSISSDSALSSKQYVYRFLITPTGTGTPQRGIYETQTQLFSKRVGLAQIRVYTEPTVAGNSFQLDVIGADGNVVADGTYTYTFGDTTDPQSGSTSLERINFNTNAKTQYSVGLRLTNTGTVNMTIKKIEIDYTEEGR